ncbi:MAG: sulfatase [Planctomycetes bacterium]|nr:sulfatase [Planctomycetota bacterium]
MLRSGCCFALALVAWTVAAERASAGTSQPPLNVVAFLIDDQGFTDLGCMGSKVYETPGVDRLAAQGMRFTHAYSACTVCSPSRAALLTGRYPARLHVTDWIAGHVRPWAKLKIPDWTKYLPLEEVTLAEYLRDAGYATGMIGKWHLGGEGYEPSRQGFDVAIAGDHRGQPPSYFSPYNIPTLADGPAGEYLTDRLGDEACKFIESNRQGPFFLYLPNYAVHTPIQPPPDLKKKYDDKLGYATDAANKKAGKQPTAGQQNNPGYAAMVDNMSVNVERVLKKLDETGVADRTIVIFTSDNGGLINVTGNQPARVGKGSAYEGGVRVPLIVRWPGVIKPGSTCDVPVMTIDLLPTVMSALGLKASKAPVDGRDITPLLKQETKELARPLYWHYPHYHPGGATPYGAIRVGDYRLVEFYEDHHVELYNLKNDVGETRDLAKIEPKRAAQLRQQLADWRREVGAQMPTPNPDYDPARETQPERPARPPQRTAAR